MASLSRVSVGVMVLAAGLAYSVGAVPVLAQGSGGSGGNAGAARAAASSDALPIRKITMYRSGVGSFEREGQLDGNAQIQLRFKTDQINDILKSMYLMDFGGRVESVSYGSKEPIARRLASFGIDIADNPSAGQLLERLRGTSVKIVMPDGEVSGTIMNVEKRPTVLQGGADRPQTVAELPWINLLTKTGVRSLDLTKSSGFTILDEALAEELGKALATLAEYRADRTKTVDIRFSGQGSRRAVVTYVHEMPVWKTSYRLVLPDDAKDKSAVIQGWAIVENTTDEDWQNVQLALVSGRPVSFQMDLYEPLFTARPFLPVPTIPGVSPRAYGAGMDQSVMEMARAEAEKFRAQNDMDDGRPGSPAGTRSAGRAMRKMDMASMPAPAAAAPGDSAGTYAGISAGEMVDYAARAQAAAGEVGEIFQYQLEAPVTIDRQRSAMLPILASNIDGRRVSIFTVGEGTGEHPMRGVELINKTDLQLLPGPISVYDGAAYAGDAQIGHVSKNDKRLLAYSVDLDVNVVTKSENDSNVVKLRIVNGMFDQTVKSRLSTTYAFDNKDAKRARTIVVETPKMPGWDLKRPEKPTEETQNQLRFEVDVEPAKAATLTVTHERVTSQSIGVVGFDMPTLLAFHKQGKVSDAVLAAFREVGKRQGEINDTNRQIAEIQRQSDDISKEQARIRENMGRLDRNDPLFARYTKKLSEQETTLEDLKTRRDSAQAKLEQQQNSLNDYLRTLNVE